MRVAVTGATGLLGRYLVRELVQSGAEVRAWLRETSNERSLASVLTGLSRPSLALHRGSLADPIFAAKVLEGCDVLFHVAGALDGPAATLFWHNVRPMQGILEAAARATVNRFVLVSSIAVYSADALRPHSLVDESLPIDVEPHRRDPYTFSKVIQEQIATREARRLGLPLVVVRPGVIFGPGRGALSSRIGLRIGPLLLWLSGEADLPYTYAENCAAAVASAGLTVGVEGAAFNVVDDQLPTARCVLQAYRAHGHRIRTVQVPPVLVPGLIQLYDVGARHSRGQLPRVLTRYRSASHWKPMRYSNRHAHERLGWQPRVGLAEALDRSIPQASDSNSSRTAYS
jgi:nucleoside-diphosphate-sugar epimerase